MNKVVNNAVQGSLECDRSSRKRKYTTTFTPENRASIGHYAAENGNASAVKNTELRTMWAEHRALLKRKYLEEVKLRRIMTGVEFEEVRSLPKRMCGKKVLLGELDVKVQDYIQALCSAGTPIGSSVVMAAATGIVMACDRTLLHGHGGPWQQGEAGEWK